ncbi:tetratricopeptide repeat protein [Roseofilum sp. BLCC_M154]|uniref:Tetratricopeptide repeat protein n=1 Tax=Roseofilum acuticapitatum BLCC-M154 TaxID=3022444 RepID=A0ABT7AS95_9CYAN|nr:tetratricopeptide repeat protein [Roseofilum acuticapitatum]MDJ1169769.1 tetratricopeptide repeat protein [Roseofilum acuticapitatum BLCC-M154]
MDVLTQRHTRLLGCTALLLGGNLCQGALAPLGLSVAAVVGGMIANDAIPQYMENLTVRLRDSEGQLDNHDLAKAVGLAIGLLIQARVEAGTYKSSKQELVSLAKCALKHWKTVAQELKAMENEKFDPIQGDRVLGWFSQGLGSEPVQVLTEADWLELLEELRVYAHVQLGENVLKQLAIDLRDKFAFALREVLKADCSEGGKAFGGLVISLLGAIHAGLQEVQVPQESREDVNQALAKLGELQQELARSEAENQARFRELSAQLGVGIEVILGEIDRTQEILDRLRGWLGGQFEQVLAGQQEILAGQNRLGITLTQEIQESEGRIIGYFQQKEERQKRTGVATVGDTVPTVTDWQGRVEELETLNGWLDDENRKLGVIVGIGGVGKSTLVARVYWEREDFEVKYWTDLGASPPFGRFARQVLEKLVQLPLDEIEKIPDAELGEALVQQLQRRRFLLVLDNFESVVKDEKYGQFLQRWLGCCRHTEILMTTQVMPQFSRIVPNRLSLSGLLRAEGGKLLKALGVGGEAQEREDYSEKVAGHPLTLRLVAGMLEQEIGEGATLAHLDELNLADVRQLMADSRIQGEHRQEIVQLVVVLERSFSRLPSVWQGRLLRLTVLRQGFDAALVSAMVAEEVSDKELRQLAERGFLVKGEGRYEFQPFILEYLQYRAGDVREAHKRAVEVYRSRCQMPEDWKTATVEDVQDYLELFYHLCQLGEYEQAFDVLHNEGKYEQSVSQFLDFQGYNSLYIIELYQQLVEHLPNQQDSRYPDSLNSLGVAYYSQGDYEQAISYYQKALEIRQEIGDRSGIAKSFNNLGLAYCSQGDYGKAISNYQKAIEIFQQIGDCSVTSTTLMNLGNAYYAQGDYGQAMSCYQQALEIRREIGDCSGIANSLIGLGNAYNSQGEYERVISYSQQALEIFQEIGDRSGIAQSLGNLGLAYQSQGDYGQAISYSQKCLEILQEIGDHVGIAESLHDLGATYQSQGDYGQAISYSQQSLKIKPQIVDLSSLLSSTIGLSKAYGQKSLEIYEERGNRSGLADSLMVLGLAYQSQKDYEQAISYYQKALELFQQIRNRSSIADSFLGLGLTYNSQGDYGQAISYYQKALEIYQQIGKHSGSADCLGNLGNVYSSQGDYGQAISYYQQSLKIFQQIGDRYWIATSLRDLGLAYIISQGDCQQAISYFQQSLEIFQEIGEYSDPALSLTLIGLGLAYISQGDCQQGISNLQKGLKIFQEIGNYSGVILAFSFYALGLAYHSQGDYARAIDSHEQSLKMFQEIGDKPGEIRSLQNLSIVHSQLGQYQQMSYYNQQLLELQGMDAFPQWLKSFIRFAQKGWFNFALCFIAGVVAFPFALLWIIAVLLYWRIRRTMNNEQ